jgi:hypothetical protein
MNFVVNYLKINNNPQCFDTIDSFNTSQVKLSLLQLSLCVLFRDFTQLFGSSTGKSESLSTFRVEPFVKLHLSTPDQLANIRLGPQ